MHYPLLTLFSDGKGELIGPPPPLHSTSPTVLCFLHLRPGLRGFSSLKLLPPPLHIPSTHMPTLALSCRSQESRREKVLICVQRGTYRLNLRVCHCPPWPRRNLEATSLLSPQVSESRFPCYLEPRGDLIWAILLRCPGNWLRSRRESSSSTFAKAAVCIYQ